MLLIQPICLLFGWSYCKTVTTHPGIPTMKAKDESRIVQQYIENGPSIQETDEFVVTSRNRASLMTSQDSSYTVVMEDDSYSRVSGDYNDAVVVEAKKNGGPRVCSKCLILKPNRCHHCSNCGQCILKFDHHCPWVNNCVGFYNYKFFLLFIFYGFIYCSYISIASIKIVFKSPFKEQTTYLLDIQTILLILLSSVFCICLAIFQCVHTYFVLYNRTTLENLNSRWALMIDSNRFVEVDGSVAIYSLGFRKNILQVFGRDPKLWFIPVFSS